jgi:hypothetical protein
MRMSSLKTFGTQRTKLDIVAAAERCSVKYEKLSLKLVKLVGNHEKKPSLGQIVMSC